MSEEYLMSSADAAAATRASSVVLLAISQTWQGLDGPSSAWFTYRRRQGADQQVRFISLDPLPRSSGEPLFGHRDIDVLAAWFPDVIDQLAVVYRSGDGAPITPETHVVVWRQQPQFHRDASGRWLLHCRVAFMPKDAWILEAAAEDMGGRLCAIEVVEAERPE